MNLECKNLTFAINIATTTSLCCTVLRLLIDEVHFVHGKILFKEDFFLREGE